MKINPLGVPGAPLETLQAVQANYEGVKISDGQVIMITNQQGHRDQAQYAALIRVPNCDPAMTSAAFGPQFGEAGSAALHDLAVWADTHGLVMKETVVSSGDFTRVTEEPEEHDLARLLAAANPTDKAIYLTQLKPQDD